jgi:ABC-2 type transport system permease protein
MNNLLQDTWYLYRFNLKMSIRNFVWIVLGLFQPICYLVLFAPLLKKLVGFNTYGYEGAFNVFTPGLLILGAIFSTAYGGYEMIFKLKDGVIERLRVTAVNRTALVLGLVLRDVTILMMQACVLVGLSLFFGLRPHPLGFVLTLVLLALIGTLIASSSYALGLAMKDLNAFSSTQNFFMQPLLLLSGIMLPMTLAPRLLKIVADINPFTHFVEASRALMNGDFGNNDILLGYGLAILLSILAIRWAVSAMRQATA